MKIRNALVTYSALVAALGASAALAQPEDLEVSITLVPEHVTLPIQVTRTLQLPAQATLPESANPQAQQQATSALNEAAAARDAGRLNAETARQETQESREEFGRAHMPDLEDLPPGQVPPAEPPVDPQPPTTPGPPDPLPGGPPSG